MVQILELDGQIHKVVELLEFEMPDSQCTKETKQFRKAGSAIR
jgi:hypothetical protein